MGREPGVSECEATKRFTDPVRIVKCGLPAGHDSVHIARTQNDTGVVESYGWGSATKEER